jgi:hypothetical protein
MAQVDFINQLKALGYAIQEPSPGFFSVEYIIPIGKFAGRTVTVAFQIGDNFPLGCPPGPHFKPHLLPITGGGGCHPFGAIHASPLGTEWQYWSRPFKEWNKTDRTVKSYLAHIKNLLFTIP